MTTLTDAPPVEPRRRTGTRAGWIALWVVVGAIALYLCVTTDRFATWENARAILIASTAVGITAIGATFLTLVGSIASLATSQQVSLLAMIFIAAQAWGLPVALLVTVAAGALFGALQGYAVGAWSANSIVLTIAVGFGLVGVSTWVTGGRMVAPSDTGFALLNATPLGIPIAVYVLCALAVVAELTLRWTTPGRQVLLVGENVRAARAAGLPVTRITVFAWTMFGVASGVGAAFLAAFNRQANITLAGNLTFDVIAAILVGGTLISGGRGSALRTLGGAVVIAAITNLLLLRGFSTGAQMVLKGALVLVIVVVVHLRTRGGTR
ncbi:ABC transporter permease [Microbacterium sp. RD1]|uniref:ABC transporter permease n=1 Tax=Microbacterium sp. RD1 TaxID=3457313 RepID=UPI003FA56D78